MADAKALSERVVVHRLGGERKSQEADSVDVCPVRKGSAATGSNDDTSKTT